MSIENTQDSLIEKFKERISIPFSEEDYSILNILTCDWWGGSPYPKLTIQLAHKMDRNRENYWLHSVPEGIDVRVEKTYGWLKLLCFIHSDEKVKRMLISNEIHIDGARGKGDYYNIENLASWADSQAVLLRSLGSDNVILESIVYKFGLTGLILSDNTLMRHLGVDKDKIYGDMQKGLDFLKSNAHPYYEYYLNVKNKRCGIPQKGKVPKGTKSVCGPVNDMIKRRGNLNLSKLVYELGMFTLAEGKVKYDKRKPVKSDVKSADDVNKKVVKDVDKRIVSDEEWLNRFNYIIAHVNKFNRLPKSDWRYYVWMGLEKHKFLKGELDKKKIDYIKSNLPVFLEDVSFVKINRILSEFKGDLSSYVLEGDSGDEEGGFRKRNLIKAPKGYKERYIDLEKYPILGALIKSVESRRVPKLKSKEYGYIKGIISGTISLSEEELYLIKTMIPELNKNTVVDVYNALINSKIEKFPDWNPIRCYNTSCNVLEYEAQNGYRDFNCSVFHMLSLTYGVYRDTYDLPGINIRYLTLKLLYLKVSPVAFWDILLHEINSTDPEDGEYNLKYLNSYILNVFYELAISSPDASNIILHAYDIKYSMGDVEEKTDNSIFRAMKKLGSYEKYYLSISRSESTGRVRRVLLSDEGFATIYGNIVKKLNTGTPANIAVVDCLTVSNMLNKK